MLFILNSKLSFQMCVLLRYESPDCESCDSGYFNFTLQKVQKPLRRFFLFSNYYHKHVSLKLYMTQVTHPTAPFTSTPCGRRAPGTLQTARPCYLGGPAPRPGPGSEFSEPTVAILATSLGGG